MQITIAICTWNRAKLLEQTLAEMRKLCIPAGVEWELLVVNNNCTDDTDNVLTRHSGCLPLKVLRESRQGQCYARNHAIQAARGEIILWTDDDVIVAPDWVAEIVRAVHSWPNASYWGGKSLPLYEYKPPLWVEANREHLEGMLVIRDLGSAEQPLGDRWPIGANMAFRRDVLLRYPFDTQMGLKGNDQVRGDELELVSRLRRDGFWGVWVPTAQVRHFVPAFRLTRHYLWKYFHGYGRTVVRQGSFQYDGKKMWKGAPRWLYRETLQRWLKSHLRRLFSRTEWVYDFTLAAYYSGIITESREHAQRHHRIPSTCPITKAT